MAKSELLLGTKKLSKVQTLIPSSIKLSAALKSAPAHS